MELDHSDLAPTGIIPSGEITYTEEQLDRYLAFVALPREHKHTHNEIGGLSRLNWLNRLIQAQLRTIPFENIDLHFTASRTINLDPNYLFKKFVDDDGHRGGYCLENNLFFGIILRTLGFDVVPIGGRVNRAAVSVETKRDSSNSPFRGWGHMCNIVILAGHKYLVDVGFGNNAPTFAVPLKEHYSNRNTGNNRGGSMVRMSRQYVSETGIQSKSSTEAMWIYSFKYDEHMPWIPGYCFSEIPFLLADYEVMNFYTSQHPDSWFRKNIVVSSVIFDEADRAIGDLTLFNGRVKERRNGQSRLLFESHGKSETAVALLKYFNIAV